MGKSLYIHIPFCRGKCFYCDFYSVSGSFGMEDEYVRLLCRQINRLAGKFSTIYIGGGTPTVLKYGNLKNILSSLKRFCRQGVEFTIEANPESFDLEKAKLMSAGGVNRLSVGAQSFCDRKLKKLGRIHNAGEGIRAIENAAKAHINNISVDLIFGCPGETLKSWKNDIKAAAGLPVKHISAYSLSWEKQTPFFKKKEKGLLEPISDALSADMYEFTLNYLPRKNFLCYEVSNFAKKEFLCRHNLSYWDNNEYLGLGPSAVSYLEGVRLFNVANLPGYIRRLRKGKSVIARGESLSRKHRAKETAAVKIRTAEGIGLEWFKEKTGFDFLNIESAGLKNALENKLIKYKYAKGRVEGVRLTRKGFMFCDNVSVLFL